MSAAEPSPPKKMSLQLKLVVLVVVILAAGFFLLRSPLKFSPSTLPIATMGESFEVSITVSEHDTPVSDFEVISGKLPDGLKLTHEELSRNGVISGTPTEKGEFEFVIKVSCMGTNSMGGTGNQPYTLIVN